MTKFYPLIDMDTTGTIKVPMFPTNDYKKALCTSNFALGEVSPHHYRLLAVVPNAMREYLSYEIRCPKCGSTMDSTKPHEGKYVLGEYACKNCQ